MGIGRKIAKFRRMKGWTQATLARKTGLSKGYISNVEQGVKRPKFKTLVIIAAKLGVGIDQLIDSRKTKK